MRISDKNNENLTLVVWISPGRASATKAIEIPDRTSFVPNSGIRTNPDTKVPTILPKVDRAYNRPTVVPA